MFVEELYEHHNILGGLNLQPAVGSIATVIKDVVDPVLSTRRHPNNEFVSFVDSCLAASPSCWTPNHLNIYFVGNVRSISNGHIAAVTLDPRGVSSGERPFIFVNDGGYTLGEGFVSGDQLEPEMPTGFQPSAAATYVILTHEVAHYFITRDSGCYPFLDGEHVPKDYEHLLNLESVPQIGENPGCDLSFRQSETEEVQCRHRTGSWTLPIDTCTPDPCP